MTRQKRLYQWRLSVLLMIMPLLASALAPQWQMVPTASQLTFTATQNGAPITGQFKTFTASIFFDLKTLKNSSIDIVVDINSLTVSYAELKATLLAPEWFNPKLFPKAAFKATQFKKTKNNTYQAIGTLTIRDKSAPTTLTFTVKELTPNKVSVDGIAMIKRSIFGVGQGEWASTEEVKDDVAIHFNIVAAKKPS